MAVTLSQIYGAHGSFPDTLPGTCDAVRDFCGHLADHVPRPELCMLTDKVWSGLFWRERRLRTKWHKCNGVYVIFSDNPSSVLYIGKATSSNQGLDRCWHFDSLDKDKERRWIYAFVLDSRWLFFAPALEIYLISRLGPKYNVSDTLLDTPEDDSAEKKRLCQLLVELGVQRVVE